MRGAPRPPHYRPRRRQTPGKPESAEMPLKIGNTWAHVKFSAPGGTADAWEPVRNEHYRLPTPPQTYGIRSPVWVGLGGGIQEPGPLHLTPTLRLKNRGQEPRLYQPYRYSSSQEAL